jgi:hypothetical protein
MEMKKLIAVGTAILVLLIILTGCSQSKSDNNNRNDDGKTEVVNKVYRLRGENEFIKINNGAIVLTPNLELFVGGELSFKREEPRDVKSYSAKFYFYLNGDETVINSITSSTESSEIGISIAPDLGSTSADKVFNSAEVWDIITRPDALHFSLSGTLINGETFEYSIIVNVNEA